MILQDVIAPDGRIFLKPEWGPISDEWPAVSFTRSTVGNRLRREFNPDRDVILYVGTGSPEATKEPEHRRRLLSAVKVEPNATYETSKLGSRQSPGATRSGNTKADGLIRWPFGVPGISSITACSRPDSADLSQARNDPESRQRRRGRGGRAHLAHWARAHAGYFEFAGSRNRVRRQTCGN